MRFVVEDGTGLSDATSYASIEYANEYADTFFSEAEHIIWDSLTENQKKRFLNRSTAYIDRSFVFPYTKLDDDQALMFPRQTLEVPNALLQAVCLVSIREAQGVDLEPDLARGGKVIRERVDVLETVYSEGASPYTVFTQIENLLYSHGLITSKMGRGNNITLRQA